ncbi:GumC family protein [Hymenobacter glacieicola]|uniref:Polysaccharide chain length determinant N-terminal domain-containing protein n=1 Tax=Hymenobacter glacieicola TaxID=1562124 RepID=A0ABQ1WYI0_9BACT|nr:hypothetical protein [Hymenobacter glacieicola]GGG50864.1 hypothetical protein GCM10011378_28770 [Hymenobacter glacieicola]
MTLKDLYRLLRRHWLLLLLVPLVTTASVFYFGRNRDKKYTSDTVIYTGIASGYKIDGDNNAAGGGWNAASTAFDNLLSLITSRDTREEVCLRLLARHLLERKASGAAGAARPQTASAAPSGVLAAVQRVLLPAKLATADQPLLDSLAATLAGSTEEETLANLTAAYRASNTNAVYKLFYSKHPYYSEAAMWNISANRVKDSDLLRIEYSAKNPQICRETLDILTQVFIRKHKELFVGQNENVIGYFDAATQKAYTKLQAAEQKLLQFHQKHNIVDYDKQMITSTEERQLTADKFNELEMQYAGASSALKSTESALGKRGVSNLKSQEILRLRNRLADLNGQISEVELLNKSATSPDGAARLANLNQQVATVSNSLDEAVSSYDADTRSTQGVAVKDLLQDYTKNVLQVEDLRGQLSSMRRQKENFTSQYNSLVPLGAEIRKIRREVEIAEKEYMSQVEGLKQSKLSQQNVELASQLKVVDPPNLPATAGGTRLLVLLLGGLIGSFLFTGAGVVVADLLNNSLQKPTLATKVTSFPVMGIIPNTTNLNQKQLLDAQRAEDQLARQLLLKMHQKDDSTKPFMIGVLSSQSGEGKTTLATSLTASLNNMKIKTLGLFPNDHADHAWLEGHTSYYSPLQGLSQGVTVADLVGTRTYNNAVIIVEFPALLEATYPASLLQSLDLILVAVKATRSWEQADKKIFENIRNVSKAPIEVVLNGVLPEYVTDFIGARVKSSTGKRAGLPPRPLQGLLNP